MHEMPEVFRKCKEWAIRMVFSLFRALRKSLQPEDKGRSNPSILQENKIMFGIKKQSDSEDNNSARKKVEKNLIKIMKAVEKEEDFSKEKEKVLELSSESNKEELLRNFVYKVETFLHYYEDEEEKELNFPITPWVDSFFETE